MRRRVSFPPGEKHRADFSGPLQPCNRALFSPLSVPIVLLAHGCTLASWKFEKIMPEGFGKMLDAIAALGFAAGESAVG